MTEKPKFLNFEECRKEFDLSYKQLIKLVRRKGCPMLPRSKGEPYMINKNRFGEWLDKQVR